MSGPALSLLTVNVNGLGGRKKLAGLCKYVQDTARNPDVVLLQECKRGCGDQVEGCLRAGLGAGTPWQGELAYSPGSASARGTAIWAPRPHLLGACTRSKPATDEHGRVVCWDWDLHHHRLRILAVYAPAEGGNTRAAFFEGLAPFLDTTRTVLMGGDFNCVLGAEDEAAPSPCRQQGAEQLHSLVAAHSLADPWAACRGRTPQGRGFTHPATAKQCSPARLDRWYVSQGALGWVDSVQCLPGAPADHHGVLLRLRLPGLPPLGRRGWRFPCYMLYHPRLKLELQDELGRVLPTLSPTADPRDTWEAAKLMVRSCADHLHREHLKQCRASTAGAQLVAQAALRMQSRLPHSAAAREAAAAATAQARAALVDAGEAAHSAQDAVMQHQGERATKLFHSLARGGTPRDIITALQVPGAAAPTPLTGPDAVETISAAAHAHYSSDSATGLFRPGAVDAAAQDELLQHLQRTLPASQRDAADAVDNGGRLSGAELMAALAQSANGKSPGTDGLPYEVYRAFWPQLGPLLLAATSAAFDAVSSLGEAAPAAAVAAALPPSWREGIITLLYKGKSLLRELLASYRPITLLNCDYKLVSKAFSNRLQPALSELIDELQTAFLAGRDGRENALYHQSLVEYLASSGQQGALLMLDIEKAYDRVDRGWLLKVAGAMGFGQHALTWLRLFTADGRASVLVNGHLSDPFPVRGGLEQGSTLAPVLWTIQLEPLTAYLHHLMRSRQLRTPTLPDGTCAPPVTHHADDTNLLVLDAGRDGPVAMAAVTLYCRASNARVSPSKCKGVTLGAHPQLVGDHAATGVAFVPIDGPDPPRHLGVPLTPNGPLASQLCYTGRLQRLRQLGGVWRQFALSMKGRAYIAKQVLGNSLAYHLGLVPMAPPSLVSAKHDLARFVAWSLLPEDVTLVHHGRAQLLPKPEVACLALADGGLGHIDLEAFAAALMAKTLAQLAQPGRRPWQVLLRGQLADAAPPGTQGWGWVYGTCPIPDTLPWRLQAIVQAYRATHPQRLPLQEGRDDARAVLVEPLFYNAALLDPTTGQPFALPDGGPSDGWPRTVAELRQAAPRVQQHPAVQAVLAAAPVEWRQLLPPDPLAAEEPATPSPRMKEIAGEVWVVLPDGHVQAVTVTGRLVDAPAGGPPPPPPGDDWVPACVLLSPKPKALWTAADWHAYRAAAPHERAAARPMEHRLLGAWGDLQCYPASHGHDGVSLLLYEVSNARVHTTRKQADAVHGRGQVPLRPAAWPAPSAQGQPHARTSQLSRMEAEWEAARPRASSRSEVQRNPPPPPIWMADTSPASHAARQQASAARVERLRRFGAARERTLAAGSLDCSSPQWPDSQDAPDSSGGAQGGRPSPASLGGGATSQCNAGGAAAPVGGAQGGSPSPAGLVGGADLQLAIVQLGGSADAAPEQDSPARAHTAEHQAAWSRLWDCPASNRAKVLAWRVAHGRLACGSYLAAKRGGGPGQQHLCPQSTCAHQPGQHRARNTLTHVFLACPAFAAARQWFADLWAAVSGGPVPPTSDAALMLGDQPAAWEHHPAAQEGGTQGLRRLWNALRVTFLFAVWCTHVDRTSNVPSSEAVVQRMVEELHSVMWAQFRVSALPDDTVNALPLRMLTADLKPAKLQDFTDTWAHGGVLCSVDERHGGSGWTMQMRLSLQHPVPAPQVAGAMPATPASPSDMQLSYG